MLNNMTLLKSVHTHKNDTIEKNTYIPFPLQNFILFMPAAMRMGGMIL